MTTTNTEPMVIKYRMNILTQKTPMKSLISILTENREREVELIEIRIKMKIIIMMMIIKIMT